MNNSTVSSPAHLVRFCGVNDYEYVGLLWQNNRNSDKVVIHCHGNYGNFYQNSFVEVFADAMQKVDIALLSFNFKAHDGFAEGYFGNRLEYVGGAINPVDSCIEDLIAAITFCREQGFSEVFLQGHSLGCERVIAFCRTNKYSFPSVLLAPVNSKLTQEVWCRERLLTTVSDQIQTLRNKDGNELLKGQYGSPSSDPAWDYDIPIYKNSLLALLESKEIRLFDPEESDLGKIENCMVVLSAADQFNLGHYSQHLNFFQSRLGINSKIVEADVDHDFDGREAEIASICAEWFSRQ